ncbi:MAG: DUF308 domain-containing protein [Firmicutes bacterium]|nr:DUF308 domain-containing protein [Bacillota bacterium]
MVYSNPFTDIAFVVGVVMMIAGVLHTVAYLVSGRGANRLTDTALVEGLVTFFYGFAVLNNQVTDQSLTMFFGTWLTICGVTRISQSFYVSRFNPRDWAKIMPLGLVATMLGVVMMMPSLLSAVMPLMLVGGAFLIDGLSILVYAMFMRRKDAEKGRAETEARQRAEAKKQLQRTKREQRDKLRSLNKQERDAAQAKLLADQRAYEEAKKQEKLAKRQARSAMVEAQSATIPMTKEEVAEVVEGAPKEQLEEDARVLAEAKAEAEKAAEPEKPLSEGEKAVEGLAQSVAELDAASRVSFKAPEEIPVINVDDILKEKKSRRDASEGEQKLGAVNLEEVENGSRVVFEKVELPQPELASATEKNVSREDVLQKIESEKLPQLEIVDYSPIDFDESEPEPSEKVQDAAQAEKNVKDDKFFTQVLDLTWKDEEV